MGNRLKLALIGSVAAFVLAPMAHANDDVMARIEAMEAEIAALKAELAAERSARQATDASIVRLESAPVAVQAAAPPSAAPDGFTVKGTTLAWGGFIDFDAHLTDVADGANFGSTSIARDFYIPGATPVGGSGGDPAMDFTAKATRFYLTASRMIDGDKFGARLEMDFLGSGQGDERVSNSYSPRLRRAYLTYNNWLLGQEWSTFQDLSSIPDSASFLVASDGMVFVRQAMVRYTNGPWQFALENGNTTITTAAGSRLAQDTNALPDAIVRYNGKYEGGTWSLSGLVRNLDADPVGADSKLGFGVSFAGKNTFGNGGDIRYSLTAGQGVGRYVGLNSVNALGVTAGGDVEAIPTLSGLIAVRIPTGASSRISAGYSFLTADNGDLLATNATKGTQSIFAALLRDVGPITVGGELLYGTRELENGVDGDLMRLTFSTKYAF